MVRFVFFFGLFYLLWHYLSPVYNQILAPLSEQIIKVTETEERPVTASFEAAGKKILVHVIASRNSRVVTVKANGVHFDMVFLLALIWAVPNINLKRRAKIVLWGSGIVLVLHLAKIFVFVKHCYCVFLVVGDVPYCTPIQKGIYGHTATFVHLVVNQISAVLIWGLLYAKYWWKSGR